MTNQRQVDICVCTDGVKPAHVLERETHTGRFLLIVTKFLVLSFALCLGGRVADRRLFALRTGLLFHIWLRHGCVGGGGEGRENPTDRIYRDAAF